MGRVRFRGRDWVRTTFLDRNVDPGTCLTWQNHDVGKDDRPEEGDIHLTLSFKHVFILF